jgi:DNA (cytosine-5)-methyltransferase 1
VKSCQDLSLAGKGKGMSDTSTRSGMLWEVERILKELKETDSLPQVLLMENVPMIHSVDNTPDFNKLQLELTKLGYKNYWEDLIATDYGIPQTRNRCFMVSILGDYNYSFPKPIPLEKKLKDMLEDNVDEKYYLSEKMKKYVMSSGTKNFYVKPEINLEKARPLTTAPNKRAGTTTYITDDFVNGGSKLRMRRLTPIEYEKLQTIPENYTYLTGHKFEDSKRYKAIGNAWTVDIIAHIFKEMI